MLLNVHLKSTFENDMSMYVCTMYIETRASRRLQSHIHTYWCTRFANICLFVYCIII